MNDNDARIIAEEYSVSYYRSVDYIPIERVHVGPVPAPHATNDELIEGMKRNVEEAKRHVNGVRMRYNEAARLGLFDPDVAAGLSKKIRPLFAAAIETQAGDRARCLSDLRHWREYLGLALDGALPRGLVDVRGTVAWLAEMKSSGRETPEEIEAREAAAKRAMQDAYERRRLGEREPGEDDE